jgi:hypothetical protein
MVFFFAHGLWYSTAKKFDGSLIVLVSLVSLNEMACDSYETRFVVFLKDLLTRLAITRYHASRLEPPTCFKASEHTSSTYTNYYERVIESCSASDSIEQNRLRGFLTKSSWRWV